METEQSLSILIHLDHPLRDAIRYKKQIIDYNFEDTNPYIGQSQQEIDDLWLAILNAPHEVEISKADMRRANITSIQFNNGKYMTAPMVWFPL